MTCDEFRRRWLDSLPRPATRRHREWATSESYGSADLDTPTRSFGLGQEPEGDWFHHRASCLSCKAWVQAQYALDEVLANALLVVPPPGLVARLAQIPAMAAPSEAVTPVQRLLELAFFVVVALGTIGVSGAVGGLIWPVATDALQALPVLLASPLISYAQNVASTLLEALATLTLIALIILQVRPGAPRDSITPSGRS